MCRIHEDGSEQRIHEAHALARIQNGILVGVELQVELIDLVVVWRRQPLLGENCADEVPDLSVIPR